MRQMYEDGFLNTIIDKHYDLGSISGKTKLFKSGYENSNYYVKTDKGEFVIKVFEGEDVGHEIVEFESVVMKTVSEKGIKTPHVFTNKQGESCDQIDGKSVVVMPYIKGHNMDDFPLSEKLSFQVGEELAKMGNALEGFTDETFVRKEYEFDQKHLLLFEKNINYLGDHIDKNIFQEIIETFRSKKDQFDKLPSGLIHNDAVPHNILSEDGELAAIIDFGDMSFSPYIQDVAVALGGFAQDVETKKFSPKQTRAFIEGYTKHRALSKNELDFLYLLIQCRICLVILAMARRDIEYGKDPKRTTYVNNFYYFLQELRAYGKENFDKLLG